MNLQDSDYREKCPRKDDHWTVTASWLEQFRLTVIRKDSHVSGYIQVKVREGGWGLLFL